MIKEVNGFKIYHDEINNEYYFIYEEAWNFSDKSLEIVEDVARNYPK